MSTVPELAARYAALVALLDAVNTERSKASTELREALWAQGLTKGTIATPLGDLTLRENKGGTSVVVTDEDALLGWCEVNSPESVERISRVRRADREQIVGSRFVVVAGNVVDSLTGELVPFAKADTQDPAPPTPSYGASERQREVKRIAAEVAASRLSLLTDVMAARVTALDPPDYDKYDGDVA